MKQLKTITAEQGLQAKHLAAAPADVSGYGTFYSKSADKKPYFRDGDGGEVCLAPSSSITDDVLLLSLFLGA